MLLFDFSHNNFQLSVTARRDFVTNNITALTVHVKNPANLGHTAGFPFETKLLMQQLQQLKLQVKLWLEAYLLQI